MGSSEPPDPQHFGSATEDSMQVQVHIILVLITNATNPIFKTPMHAVSNGTEGVDFSLSSLYICKIAMDLAILCILLDNQVGITRNSAASLCHGSP